MIYDLGYENNTCHLLYCKCTSSTLCSYSSYKVPARIIKQICENYGTMPIHIIHNLYKINLNMYSLLRIFIQETAKIYIVYIYLSSSGVLSLFGYRPCSCYKSHIFRKEQTWKLLMSSYSRYDSTCPALTVQVDRQPESKSFFRKVLPTLMIYISITIQILFRLLYRLTAGVYRLVQDTVSTLHQVCRIVKQVILVKRHSRFSSL